VAVWDDIDQLGQVAAHAGAALAFGAYLARARNVRRTLRMSTRAEDAIPSGARSPRSSSGRGSRRPRCTIHGDGGQVFPKAPAAIFGARRQADAHGFVLEVVRALGAMQAGIVSALTRRIVPTCWSAPPPALSTRRSSLLGRNRLRRQTSLRAYRTSLRANKIFQ